MSAQRVTAIYPGTFDPPTNGHLDLIERGSKIFDLLIVSILCNPEKDPDPNAPTLEGSHPLGIWPAGAALSGPERR